VSSGPPDSDALSKFPDMWQEYKATIECPDTGKKIDPHLIIHK